MTVTLDRPLPPQVRALDAAQRWLNGLPNDRDLIADFFRAEGLFGRTGHPNDCPVACGLTRAMAAEGVSGTPWVSAFDINIDNYREREDNGHTTKPWGFNVGVPVAVGKFILGFDSGRYEDLEIG